MARLDQIDFEIQQKLQELATLRKERNKYVKTKKKFVLRCSYDVVLSEDEIWSDGDAPINPKIKDVMRVIGNDHAMVLVDWNLEPKYSDKAKIVVYNYKGN